MSDNMGSFSGGGYGGGTPARLLRQQKRAIKQAGKKLQEIDKQYSTKALKDEIEAETLLSDLDIGSQSITIVGTTVGGIIQTKDNQIILVKNNKQIWGFPKGTMEPGESETQTLFREIQEETNLLASQLTNPIKIGEYLAFSPEMNGIKKYIFYDLKLLDNGAVLKSDPNDKTIIEVEKFDTGIILDILGNEHQKNFWKVNSQKILSS